MDEDYRKYLSYDNGHGILISSYDKMIIDRYFVNYDCLTKVSDLIILLEKVLEEFDDEELLNVIEHLSEVHYYQEVNK